MMNVRDIKGEWLDRVDEGKGAHKGDIPSSDRVGEPRMAIAWGKTPVRVLVGASLELWDGTYR